MNATRRPVYVDRRPPPAEDNSGKLIGLVGVTLAVIVVMAVGFWALSAAEDGGPAPAAASATPSPTPTPTPTPKPTPTPTPTPTRVVTPPAPASNQLSANDWLLSPYAIVQENGALTVTGTAQNLGGAQRSTIMRVFVYVGGNPVAMAEGEVRDVPPGGAVEVSLPSKEQWTPGNKVLQVTAQDIP